MKRLLTIVTLLLGCFFLAAFISCDTDAGDTNTNNPDIPKKPVEPLFPAPTSVTVNSIGSLGSYELRWSRVNGSADYQMYGKNETTQHVARIDTYKFEGIAAENILNGFFNKYTTILRQPPNNIYRLGIRAVSVDGISSEITWSNTFTLLAN